MERVVRGDMDALGTLFERYKQPLFGFLLRTLHDQALAEDVLVDTFLRVNDRRHTYKLGLKFSTWLYAIAYHLATDRVRRLTRCRQIDEQLAQQSLPPQRDPMLEECTRSELADTVRTAVNQLPDDQRVVILLREYEGFSYREIASITGATEETVRVRAHRARQALRKTLQPYMQGESAAAVTFATP